MSTLQSKPRELSVEEMKAVAGGSQIHVVPEPPPVPGVPPPPPVVIVT